MAQLNELEDLEMPVFETWWANERRKAREKGLAEGRLEGQERVSGKVAEKPRCVRNSTNQLRWCAKRGKFGAETADDLAGSSTARAGRDLLEQAVVSEPTGPAQLGE